MDQWERHSQAPGASGWRAGRAGVTRRELMERAGAGLAGAALASILGACNAPAQPSAAGGQASQAGQPKKGGLLKVAIIGEPPALDPTFTTATITANVTSHIFEGLFGRGANYAPKLVLAESYDASQDGLSHTFKLRKGVQFHNGKEMTSADVTASLQRWMQIGARGAFITKRLDRMDAPDPTTVTLRFKEPTGALPLYLSRVEMVVIPEEIAKAAGKDQLKEFVGTGPYKFVERQPDRFIRFVRFDNYAASSDPPDGWAGNKTAYIDEIQFIPVPEDAVRADGVTTGEYQFGEAISPDSYDNLRANPALVAYIVKPYYWYVTHFNKKEGVFTDVRARRAVLRALSQEPIARAGFANPEFYRIDPGIAAPETPWFVADVGADVLGKADPEEAKRLLAEAGYDGRPIRWMATKEYSWNYNQVLPIKSQLEAIGMNVDVQVMDWATLVSRRGKSDQYDVFITGHESYGHPLLQPFLDANWPGFWDHPDKDRLVGALIAETDETKTLELIRQLQALVYSDVPFVKLDEGFLLRAGRKELQGYANPADFYFWNAWLA